VSSGYPRLSMHTVHLGDDAYVIAMSGVLSPDSVGLAGIWLAKAMAESARVLVDVSGLWAASAAAVQVFPSVLARAGGWPYAQLVLFGARPELTRTLEALRVPLTVPLAPDESAARMLLDRRPPVVLRTVDLEHAASSARRARVFVSAACDDWQLDMIRDDAMVVASELVANAVVHAGTASRLALRCRQHGMTVAVYDHRPDLQLPLRPVAENQQGHGLFMVAALSLQWGVRLGQDEKCVWAFLPTTASVTYSQSVRKSAYDAVRVVLTHGATSSDATAVQQLVAQLAEQHGMDFVRDVAVELAAELAEVSSAVISSDDH
jgi:anti-sigma regulatory factor (Ser/Thr protein kinase)/anti-anti-sigma regulatory factor